MAFIAESLVSTVWRFDQLERLGGERLRAEICSLLRTLAPDLIDEILGAHRSAAEISNIEIAIRSRFMELQSNKTVRGSVSYSSLHDWLVRGLDAGVRNLGWNIEVPAPSLSIREVKPVVSERDMENLSDIRQLDAAFISSVGDFHPSRKCWLNLSGPEDVKEGWRLNISGIFLGQILYSACRFGGLVSVKKLEALSRALRSPPYLLNREIVVELAYDDGQFEIWLPDPLSSVLLVRFLKKFGSHSDHHTAEQYIRMFLNCAVQETRQRFNMHHFLIGVRAALSFEMPPLLVGFAAGEVRNTSLRASHVATFQNRTFLKPDVFTEAHVQDEAVLRLKSLAVGQVGCTAVNSRSSYNSLIKCLSGHKSRRWRKPVTRKLEKWFAENEPRISYIQVWFYYWVLAVCRKDAPMHQGVGAASSVLKYATSIGRPLFVGGEKFDAEDILDEDAWLELYRGVVDYKSSDKSKAMAVRELQSFHQFVLERSQRAVPAIDFSRHFSGFRYVSVPRAAYLCIADLKHCQEILAQSPKTRLSRISKVMLPLLYYTGLRIDEAAGLKLKDVIVGVRSINGVLVDLIIKANNERGLKRQSSARKVPLGALMPSEDLGVFLAFVQMRCAEEGVELGGHAEIDRPLFSTADRVFVRDAEVREILQPILRATSGDGSFHIHDLRHCCACNLLLAGSCGPNPDSFLWRLFEEPSGYVSLYDRMERAKFFIPHKQGLLWTISSILGHASPDETLKSYVHILPLLLAANRTDGDLSERYFGWENGKRHTLSFTHEVKASLLGISVSRTSHLASTGPQPINSLIEISLRLWEKLSPKEVRVSQARKRADAQSLTREVPPFITPDQIYSIALMAFRGRDSSEIATSFDFPHEFVERLLSNMKRNFHTGARNQVRRHRLPKLQNSDPDSGQVSVKIKARFLEERGSFVSGASGRYRKSIGKYDEVYGFLPSGPQTEADRFLLETAWRRVSRLLKHNGLWFQEDLDGASEEAFSAEFQVVMEGIEVFYKVANSTNHAFRPFPLSEVEAVKLLRLLKLLIPLRNIQIRWSRPKALSGRDLATRLPEARGCNIVAEAGKFAGPSWPEGVWGIHLVDHGPNHTNESKGKVSQGLWLSVYLFALLLKSIKDD